MTNGLRVTIQKRTPGARCLTAAAALLGCLLSPVAAQAETFEEALVSAYTSNPTLQARRAYGRSVDEMVPQALSNWRPAVSVQGSAYHQNQKLSPGPSTTTTPSQVGVSLQQNIFRGLRTLAQTESAEEMVQAERAALTSVEQNTLFAAAQIYLVVLRDQSVVELNRNNEEVLQRQLQAVRDRFNVGELTRTDVSQAESRLAAATATRIGSEGVLKGSEATYEQIIGHPPRNLVTPEPYRNLPLTIEDALDLARRSNPAIIAAEHLWRGSRADIRDQQGRLLPTVWAEVSYSLGREISTRDIDSSAFRAGLNVTIPLYQSGAVSSQIRQAKHVAGQKRLLVDESRDSAVEQLNRSWESYHSAVAQVTAYESQIRAATIALDGVRRENEVGSRTVLDVLDAEQELLQARVNLVQAQTDCAIYSYQVLTAVGGMTAEHLRLKTPLHDPDAHYRAVRYQWFGSSTDANADADIGVNRDIVEDVSAITDLRDVRPVPVTAVD